PRFLITFPRRRSTTWSAAFRWAEPARLEKLPPWCIILFHPKLRLPPASAMTSQVDAPPTDHLNHIYPKEKCSMKIVRYLDGRGQIGYGSEQPDGSVFVIKGDLFATYQVTQEKAQIKKRLAPLAPAMIWCIGLNYKFHAQESNAKIPEYPVLF